MKNNTYVIKFLNETLLASAVTINDPKRNNTAYVKYNSPSEKPVTTPKSTTLWTDFLWGDVYLTSTQHRHV